MKHVNKSVLLWYAPREMYDLVVGVEDYPIFLPWCESAEVLARNDDGMTARLTLGKGGVRHAFTTRNRHRAGEEVLIELVDGPFSLLDGRWRFLPIGSRTTGESDNPRACRIEFEMRYGFANAALEAVISPVFDRIANTFVDSFVQRAEQVHGPR